MKTKHLEQKVGAFVLAGLVMVGILIIAFGRFGQFFQPTYDIIAEFPNASGIIKNSQVLYRGAKVGFVPQAPQIAHQGEAVEIVLRVYNNVLIPRNADFRIGVYGLLGDRYVDIIPPDPGKADALKPGEARNSRYLIDGDRVQGSENPSVSDLLASTEAVIQDIQAKLLTKEFINNFHQGMLNAKNMLERGDKLLAEAERGKGVIHTLLKDKETARNLRRLIANLRAHGILFYEDSPPEEKRNDPPKKRRSRPPYSSRRR